MSPPDGTVGKEYSYTFAADGAPAPTYRWGTGDQPPGLTLEPNGVLHGSPTTAKVYTFSIDVGNAAGAIVSPDMRMTIR